jgi:hypothetical protein
VVRQDAAEARAVQEKFYYPVAAPKLVHDSFPEIDIERNVGKGGSVLKGAANTMFGKTKLEKMPAVDISGDIPDARHQVMGDASWICGMCSTFNTKERRSCTKRACSAPKYLEHVVPKEKRRVWTSSANSRRILYGSDKARPRVYAKSFRTAAQQARETLFDGGDGNPEDKEVRIAQARRRVGAKKTTTSGAKGFLWKEETFADERKHRKKSVLFSTTAKVLTRVPDERGCQQAGKQAANGCQQAGKEAATRAKERARERAKQDGCAIM